MFKFVRCFFVAILIIIAHQTTAQINKRQVHYVGQELILDGKYESAIDVLNVLIKIDKTSADAYFLRGIAKYNLGDYIGAESDFTSTIDVNSVYTMAYHYRAITRSYLGNYDDSLADFAKAISIRPDQEGLYYSRGVTYFLSQQFENAIEDFNHFLRRKPNTVDAYVTRGTSHLLLQDTVSAFNDFDRAVKTNKYNPSGFFRRGSLYLQLKEYEKADNDLSEAIKLDTLNVPAYFNRALVYNALNKPLDAVQDFNKVLMLDSLNSVTYFNRALLLSQIGDYNKAMDDYDKVAMLSPQNVLLYFNRGILSNQLGDVEKAESDFTRAIELYPDFANAYMNRSAVRYRMGKMDQSKTDYNIAQQKIKEYREKMTDSTFSIFADTSRVFSSLLSFNSDFGKDNVGEINPNNIVDIKPSSMKRFAPAIAGDKFEDTREYVSNSVEKEQEKYKEYSLIISDIENLLPEDNSIGNEEKIDEMLDENSNDPNLNFAKGVLQHAKRQYSNALRHYTNAIKNDAMNPFYYMNRAVADAEMIEFVSQIDNQSHSLVIDADPVNQLKNIKRIYNYDTALSDINKAIMLDSSIAEFHYNKGCILTMAGDLVRAIESYTKAIELDPHMTEAFFNRGMLQISLKEIRKGFMDISQAGDLGSDKAYEVIKRYGSLLKE